MPGGGQVPRLIVKGPDGQSTHTLELGSDGSVLIGRSPDSTALREGADQHRQPVKLLAVDAPSVSANHLLAWTEQGRVCVEDVGSRNGSWLELPRTQAIRTESDSAVVQLARASRDSADADEPQTPVWHGRGDFASALANAISSWLKQQSIAAQ